jgi:hypothetical protein
MPLPEGVTNICDHCGTVTNYFRQWEEWETLGCPCACHIPLEQLWPDWAAGRKTKKKKGKQ